MPHLLRFKAFVIPCLFYSLIASAQTTNTYTTNTTWAVPAGISTIVIKVYGGGGGVGGRDCGAGCGNAAAGPVGYVFASYTVTPGDIIGIYPGAKGANGLNNTTANGGGSGGVSTYNSSYNGGNGGNAGPSGSSGGGGGGGAASLVTINSVFKIVAGGAGAGGGMANSYNSGKAGSSNISANGTSNTGGNGAASIGDGGGGGGGGGGQYGSVGGTVYSIGAETAGNGGYRGNNSLAGATSTFYNTYTTWTNAGRIEITYSTVSAGGTASSSQTICSGNQPAALTLSNFAGSSIQWQYSDNNSTWNNIAGATLPDLTGAQMGSLSATRYYRAVVDGSALSSTVTITVLTMNAGVAPSGSGTEADPYLISSMDNLQWITSDASRWDQYYKQTVDIDASVTYSPCYNSGAGWSPVGNSSTNFTGSYDGQGFSITDLYINRTGDEYVGLFGFLWDAEISNLSLVNANIYGGKYTGGLAGAADSDTRITNVHISGNVSGTAYDYEIFTGGLVGGFHGSQSVVDQSSSSAYIYCYDYSGYATCSVGGLFGEFEGTCQNSFSTGNVTVQGEYNSTVYAGGLVGNAIGQILNSYANGYVEVWNVYDGNFYGGGFAGKSTQAIINCYSTGYIINYDSYMGSAAGFVGENGGQITNCYSLGNTYAYTTVGGFIANDYGTVTNSFYDMDINNMGDDGSGRGRTTAEMRELVTFFNASWDLKCETKNGADDIWRINSSDNNGYPSLSWQDYTMNCPEWTGASNTTFGTNSNWSGSFVPAEGMDIVMSASATNDLVLPQNWQVGNLSFNGAGKLIKLGNYNLTSGGMITSTGTSDYIQTNGSGLLQKNIDVDSSFNFPVGNTAYSPVSITNNSNVDDDFTVNVLDEVYANGSDGATVTKNRVQHTWNIGKANANDGSGTDFVFNWNSGETSGTIITPSPFHYGTAWDIQTVGTTSSTSTSLTYAGYTGTFSPFSVMEGSSTLPVSWLSFTAQKQNNTTLLKWSTASEQGTESYTVQHSANGITWEVVGVKPAAGNSNTIQQYSFVHTRPVEGMNYYRLVQKDIDGKENYSQVASINFGKLLKQLIIYPNPVSNGQLNVKLAKPATVQIFNSTGLLVLQKELPAGEKQLTLTQLSKGIYTIKAGEERISFVIQ
jgi:hypothetical protein